MVLGRHMHEKNPRKMHVEMSFGFYSDITGRYLIFLDYPIHLNLSNITAYPGTLHNIWEPDMARIKHVFGVEKYW